MLFRSSVRLIDALGSADIIAAEDTRRTRALADALGVEITGKVVSNYDHNESDRAAMTICLKADQSTKMGIITDVKQELRRANALKISYAASKSLGY